MQRAVREITVIPPTLLQKSFTDSEFTTKRKVAAYARVSTDNEEQISSFEAQRDYYMKYIKSKVEWEFVDIYKDEGISGTSTKKRDGFNRMISDALEGKIDLIITKSVSRFARNTVDTLTTVRRLKEKQIEVYFEKENIFTLDSKGELLITIMSSLAQEESRSLSENVTWGQRKRLADGKINLPYKNFLGYEKGDDGFPKIVKNEATVIRHIYKSFLDGKTPSAIARTLTTGGIPTPSGKEKWQSSTVESILKNEKYKGDALLQKTFTTDFLTKKKKINEGEVPQYYVENSHPFIINPEVFDLVQEEMQKRKASGRQRGYTNCFSNKIICGECGSFYGCKVWHSNSKYRKVIWQCNYKYKNKEKCKTPHLYEDELKKAFVVAFNSMVQNKDDLISNYDVIIARLTDNKVLDLEQNKFQDELDEIIELIRKCVEENANTAIEQQDYNKKYSALVENYNAIKKQLKDIETKRTERAAKKQNILKFIENLRQSSQILLEFEEAIWNATVELIKVNSQENITFIFKDGTEIDWKI